MIEMRTSFLLNYNLDDYRQNYPGYGRAESCSEEEMERVSSIRKFVLCMDSIPHTFKTYLLTPWSRVLLEKLTSKLCSDSRNSPHLWNPKVPHRTHK